jgi:hypothetical protein
VRTDYVERYLRSSGAVGWSLAEVGEIEIEPHVARVVSSLASIEADSTSQAAKIERAGFTRAPDVAAFLPRWYEEEQEHARFLFAVAEHCGLPAPDQVRSSTAVDQRGQPAASVLPLLGRLPGADCAYLTTAAAAECTARFVYSWLAAQFEPWPPVSDAFGSLARQEARHLGFYRTAAAVRLERSAMARLGARQIFARYWRPVGIDTLGWLAWFETFSPLIRDPVLQRRLLEVDRLVGSLPGFEGSEPMRSFLEEHGLHHS